MQTYHLDPNDYPTRQRRILKQSILLLTILTVAILAFLNRGGITLSLSGILSLACPATSALLIGGLLIWATLRHIRAQWFSYELMLADDWIGQRGNRLPNVDLQRSQITAIEEYPETGLKLQTSDKRTYILVPAEVTEYATIRDHVASWYPIVQKQSATQLLFLCLAGGGVMAILLTALTIANSVLTVSIIAVPLIGAGIWGAVRTQRNRTLPSWTKIFIWLSFLLILIIVAERILTVI